MGGWLLLGNTGMRPFILRGTKKGIQLRDQKLDLMIPFDPNHPDARFILLADHHFDRLEAALRSIAYEPLGHAEASYQEVYNHIVEKARAALAELDKETQTHERTD